MIKEVLVFSIEGDTMVTLDTNAHCEIRINIADYDKHYLSSYIGKKILVEEEGGEHFFAGTSLLKYIN